MRLSIRLFGALTIFNFWSVFIHCFGAELNNPQPNPVTDLGKVAKREVKPKIEPKHQFEERHQFEHKHLRDQNKSLASSGQVQKGNSSKRSLKQGPDQIHPEGVPATTGAAQPSPESRFKFLQGTQEILSETAQDLYALVDSPAIRHALAAGTYAANTAVTNAMDALFYSLLDRTWPIAKGQFTTLESGIERRLTRLPDKSILVIDRMMIGPRMTRDLIPPSPLGLQTSVASGAYFYEFYLTSDADRINQTTRQLQNNFSAMNWFGLLPFLTRILPPSFDPNELYNPLRVFTVPFKIPLNKKLLQEMQENSIRSYSIKGSISFPLTHSWLNKNLPFFANKTGLDAGLPISVYANAEARVSVHKHSKNLFKISLSDINVEGSSIGLEIGKVFYALGLSAGKFSWKGMPVAIFPFRVSFEKNLFQDQSIIREIDINQTIGEGALVAALTGNFTELDRICQKCGKIEKVRNGRNSKISGGFSGFFFDTKNESSIETNDFSILTSSKNLSYRESRSDATSVSWDIMNGASSSSQSFAWSSPREESLEKPLIWTRSSLTIPSIDEENFAEFYRTLSLLGLHQNSINKTTSQSETISTRSSNSLQKMAKMPSILSSQKLFDGPKITGDLDLLFDLYTNEMVIQKIAQIPAESIMRHLNEIRNLRSKFFETGLCAKGIFEIVSSSMGLDICSIEKTDLDDINKIQKIISFNISYDKAKSAQATLVKKIGSLGFIYLVSQTQSEKDYRLFVNTRCLAHRKSTSSQKDNCQNMNKALYSLGKLPLDDFSWWKPDQTEKQEVIKPKAENLEILNITPSPIKEDLDSTSQDFFDINLKDNLKGRIFVYIRIESKGDMDLTRSFLFEDVFETDLGYIDSASISIPYSFLEKSNTKIKSYKVNQLRFKIAISKDGKTWTKTASIDGSS